MEKDQEQSKQQTTNNNNNNNNNKQQQQQSSPTDILEIREASHAASWYSANPLELDKQISVWLDLVKSDIKNLHLKTVKCAIGPHNAFAYSGPTCAWTYKYIKPVENMKVFILGPCHQIYIRTAAIPNTKYYATPLGNIVIDQDIIKELHQQGKFDILDKDADEEEHSIEMHLPFIKKIFGKIKFKLIPIMVGSIDEDQEEEYAKILQPYFEDDNSLFIISTDFCHWGTKFNYTQYNEADGEIFESIEKMDKPAMEALQDHNPSGFAQYMKTTKNTICGKHPLGIILRVLKNSKHLAKLSTQFIRYAQSFPIKDKTGNCISFAAAVTYFSNNNEDA